MKKIYFFKDQNGFKYTAWMFTNRRAAEKRKPEAEARAGKKLEIDFGFAFSH